MTVLVHGFERSETGRQNSEKILISLVVRATCLHLRAGSGRRAQGPMYLDRTSSTGPRSGDLTLLALGAREVNVRQTAAEVCVRVRRAVLEASRHYDYACD